MKQTAVVLFALFVALGLGSFGAPALAGSKPKGESKAKEKTVMGEVVDISCYLAHGDKATGADHQGCAEACAKAGGPLGILTKGGKLYLSVMPDDHKAGPNALLMDYIGQKVSATGMIRAKHGMDGIMISKVEKAGTEEKKD